MMQTELFVKTKFAVRWYYGYTARIKVANM